MSGEISFGEIRMGVSLDASDAGRARVGTFRIGILGDFSGRANRGQVATSAEIAACPVRAVDRDNVETLPETLGARLDRTVAGPDGEPISIAFGDLDDFHPDRLFERLELFSKLRQLRRQLANPDSFERAAAVVEGWLEPEPPEKPAPEPAAAPPGEPPSIDNLLDATLAATDAQGPGESRELTLWHRLIHDITAPYALPKIGPRQQQLTACVDAATARAMSGVIHHPDFQSLEASWRNVDLLVRRLETDETLKVFLLDISREELEADLNASDDLAQSGLYRLLVEKTLHTPGGQPWSLLVGDYGFGTDERDVRMLGRLARIADAARAPLVASARGSVVGCPDPTRCPDPDDWQPAEPARAGWEQLRALPASRSLALTWPRFLARLPYGRKSSPVESFDYEELPDEPPHRHFLWGNSAYLCACMIGQAFTRSGWELRPGEVHELGGMPLHVYQSEGETAVRPCGEVLLNERGVRKIVEQGLIPVLSVRDQDVVRIQTFHPLAEPLRIMKLGG